ncbi:hypothetical protein N7456_011422 [Penicillium angulare]|uniref:NAD(+) ADP-ribosyltransferase n=1 Tax=Penicillium angulare TaxID=116970 RepID=A0A9W9ETZ3_9EURO|nr:hypothetical protein N7456_011422 [Penicillium angulare]
MKNNDDEQVLKNDSVNRNLPKRDLFLESLVDNFHSEDGTGTFSIPVTHTPKSSTAINYLRVGNMVWEDNGEIMDAILCMAESAQNLTIRHLQLIRSGKSGKYYIWSLERVNSALTKTERVGLGDLEDAKAVFRKKFLTATGHDWESRHEEPEKSKFAFIPRQYDRSKVDSSCILPGINSVLKLIKSTPQAQAGGNIARHVKHASAYGANSITSIDHDQLQIGVGLLKRLMKKPGCVEKLASEKDIFSAMIKCYKGIVSMLAATSCSIKSLEQEIDELLDPRNPKSPLHNSLRCPEVLGLEKMEQPNYFIFSTSTAMLWYNMIRQLPGRSIQLVNIFSIERTGEANRYNEWRQRHHEAPRLLWHGSPHANFKDILSEGLRGGLHCSEIFLAEIAAVSKDYCRIELNGPQALMLLCEVSSPFSQPGRSQWRDAGHINGDLAGVQMLDITMGQKITPSFVFQYQHQFVHCAQIRMRYLFHFKIVQN